MRILQGCRHCLEDRLDLLPVFLLRIESLVTSCATLNGSQKNTFDKIGYQIPNLITNYIKQYSYFGY